MFPKCLAHKAIYKSNETWLFCLLLFSPPTLNFYCNQTVFVSLNLFIFLLTEPPLFFYACPRNITWLSLKLLKMVPVSREVWEPVAYVRSTSYPISSMIPAQAPLGLRHVSSLHPPTAVIVYISLLAHSHNCLMSFHVMIFFYSFIALSRFFPFLKGVYVVIPQSEEEIMRAESHCAFHLLRGQ